MKKIILLAVFSVLFSVGLFSQKDHKNFSYTSFSLLRNDTLGINLSKAQIFQFAFGNKFPNVTKQDLYPGLNIETASKIAESGLYRAVKKNIVSSFEEINKLEKGSFLKGEDLTDEKVSEIFISDVREGDLPRGVIFYTNSAVLNKKDLKFVGEDTFSRPRRLFLTGPEKGLYIDRGQKRYWFLICNCMNSVLYIEDLKGVSLIPTTPTPTPTPTKTFSTDTVVHTTVVIEKIKVLHEEVVDNAPPIELRRTLNVTDNYNYNYNYQNNYNERYPQQYLPPPPPQNYYNPNPPSPVYYQTFPTATAFLGINYNTGRGCSRPNYGYNRRPWRGGGFRPNPQPQPTRGPQMQQTAGRQQGDGGNPGGGRGPQMQATAPRN